MPAISVGSVEVDVIPNARGIYRRLQQALVPAATRAGNEAGQVAGRAFGQSMQGEVGDAVAARIGQRLGQQIAARISTSIRDGLRDGVTQGGRTARPAASRQGEETGGAFARSLRARLEAAFRSMPRLDVRLSDTGVDAELARLRARMETLAGKTIGVDVDVAAARAEVEDIEERLRRLGAAHPNVAVRADTAAAIAQLRAVQEEIDRVSRDPARIRVETDGTFGQRLRAQVQAAEASLPHINLRADSSAAEVEIARLRGQLTALRDVRIGIDIDAATATARIQQIQTRLEALSASDADIAIRVDAGAAAAQLAAVQAMVNRLDGQTANVNVRVSGMQMLVTAALAFGPALLPVLPVAAAGLGAVAAAATAAAAGIGSIALVAVPAFKQIAGALQAREAAEDAAANAALRGGQASVQAAQRALQMASAQQALATAHRNAARQIAEAERGVRDAQRQAVEANARAAQQVKQARQALADAYQQAADRMQQANQRVAAAERSLADAQKAARQAQLDLTAARKQAALELEDLNNRLASAVLSQRDAEIALVEATAQRDRVLKNANATELDKQKAILAYDQAVQRLKEQRIETQRLQKQTAEANKAGVEGSKTVKDAQDRIAQAQQQVADRTQALKDAQAEAAKTAAQSTRAIADAQERLAEAQRNVTETQRQGAEAVARAQERVVQAQQSAADSIASAQRQIASASLSAAGGVDQAAIAQAKYRQALAEMTPAARETMGAFLRLRDAFSSWSESLQPAVMPIFTRALDGIRRALPALTPFVLEAADAIKGLQDRLSAELKTPFWQDLKKDLQGSIKPAIEGLGVAFGNVFKGMAGIVAAFLPHMDGISARMQRVTERFANWGTGLKGSPQFERFLSYASEMGPILADTLGKIGSAFLSIGQALKPFSGPLLKVLGGVAEAIGIIAEKAPWLIQGIYGIIVAVKLWTIAQAAFNLVMSANPLVLIGLAIVALIAIVIYAYNKFSWFRTGVQAAWDGIKTAALWLWNVVLKPFFEWFGRIVTWLWQNIIKPYIGFIINYWKMVASVAMWLWRNVLTPVFRGIGNVITWWWNNIVKRYFALVKGAINTLAGVFRWLYDKGVKPVWDWISQKISTIYNTGIKPTFDKLRTAVGRVKEAFETAKEGIRTAWDKLKEIAKKPVKFVVDTVYNQGIRKVWNLVVDAFGGKRLEPMKFATGGIMPGYTPGRDVHLVPSTAGPVALSGGEAIMRPEWTRAVGPGYVHTMNAAARSRGVQGVRNLLGAEGGLGFKDGGIFGIFSGIGSSIASGAWELSKKANPWLAEGFGASVAAGVQEYVYPAIKKIPGGNTGFVTLLKDLMHSASQKLLDAGKKGDELATPHVTYNPSKGVEQWRPVVLRALREVGQSAGHANRTLRRMQQESGGNPRAVNKWDINWKLGHPSVGLMQVIGPTFRAYAGKYRRKGPFMYGVSIDPLANIYSSMRYALSRYGSLPRAYDRPGGYDQGGWLPPGGLGYNGLSQPEAVLTPAQWKAIHGAAVRGTDGASLGDLHVQVYVGDREITDIARAEVRTAQGELIQVLNAS